MSHTSISKNISSPFLYSFQDSSRLQYINGLVAFKTQKSTWSEVVLNGLPLDDYFASQNFVPVIKPDGDIEKFSTFKTYEKKVPVCKPEREEEEISSWDKRPVVEYSDDDEYYDEYVDLDW